MNEDILKTMVGYFAIIFRSSKPSIENIKKVLETVKPKITNAMNEDLMDAFTIEDIEKAIMSMNPIKAPGSDGLPALFFQKSGMSSKKI